MLSSKLSLSIMLSLVVMIFMFFWQLAHPVSFFTMYVLNVLISIPKCIDKVTIWPFFESHIRSAITTDVFLRQFHFFLNKSSISHSKKKRWALKIVSHLPPRATPYENQPPLTPLIFNSPAWNCEVPGILSSLQVQKLASLSFRENRRDTTSPPAQRQRAV